MCGTHEHEHAERHEHESHEHESHEHGHCGHCNHENLTLEELKARRDQLDRDIAALEPQRADAARTVRAG